MNIKSLIESIKSATTTNASANYEINDRSFLAELLSDSRPTQTENKSDCEILGITPLFDFRRSDKFPVTLFLFRTLWKLLLIVPLCYYKCSSWFCWAISNRSTKRQSKIKSARVNFVVFFTALIVAIVLLAYMLSFFIRDVLLFDSSQRINNDGAIYMEQPCGCERYVYLYNTAIPWSNTGIEIVKGDVVEISASGAYYSRISDLVSNAKNNDTLPFNFINPSLSDEKNTKSNTDSILTNLCIYKSRKDNLLNAGEKAVFGSVLYQIRANNDSLLYDSREDVRGDRIVQDPPKSGEPFSFTADHSGELYVSVNDIYLNDTTLNLLRELHPDKLKEHIGNIYLNDRVLEVVKNKQDSLSIKDLNSECDTIITITEDDLAWAYEFKYEPSDTVYLKNVAKLAKLKAISRKHPDYWFSDNLGEIMLNIKVTRSVIANHSITEKIFSHTYRNFESFFDMRLTYILLILAGVMVGIVVLLILDNRLMHKT